MGFRDSRTQYKKDFVPARSTLLPIISRKVATLIYHDDYSVYKNLHDVVFMNDFVMCITNFVSPSHVCTSNIEGRQILRLSMLNIQLNKL